MKWRVFANGAAFVVTVGLGTTIGSASSPTTQTTASAVGGGNALEVMQGIRVENEHPRGYVQSIFSYPKDIDGDGCDAREQVLKRDSITFPQVDAFDCSVVAGDWISPYDGAHWSDPSHIDIDHVVALKEAWDSGAWAWSEVTRTAYANDTTDTRTLRAVTDRVNRQKGDRDPSNWMPPLKSDWCSFLADWVAIKARWNLSMDQSEFGRIKNVITSSCPGLTIAKWSAAPLSSTVTTGTTATTGTTGTTVRSNTSDIHPGAYCAPIGELGTYKGLSYICSITNASGTPYTGGRARWRRA